MFVLALIVLFGVGCFTASPKPDEQEDGSQPNQEQTARLHASEVAHQERSGLAPVEPTQGRRVLAPSGEVHMAGPEDFLRHPRPEKFYSEFWSYVIELTDGSIILTNLIYFHMWLLPGKCGTETVYIDPEGKPHYFGRSWPYKRYGEDPGVPQVNFGGRLSAQGVPPNPHKLHLDIDRKGGFYLDLDFDEPVQGVRVDNGLYRFLYPDGERQVFYSPVIPRAKVRGTIRVGGEERRVSGWARLDKAYLSALATFLISMQHNATFHTPDYTFSVFHFISHPFYDSEKSGLLVVSDREKVLWVTSNFDIRYENPVPNRDGYQTPTRFVVTAREGDRELKMIYVTLRDYEKFAFLDRLKGMYKIVFRNIIGNPVYFRTANRYAIQYRDGSQQHRYHGPGYHQTLMQDR